MNRLQKTAGNSWVLLMRLTCKPGIKVRLTYWKLNPLSGNLFFRSSYSSEKNQ